MNKKKYKIKKTKALINKLKPFWKEISIVEDGYWNSILEIEEKMQKETGIKDLEIFHIDGIVGIGNYSRTMELMFREEFEKNG